MKWTKSWSQELDSTLWQEADPETRLVFYGLRLLAGRQDRAGKIKYLDNNHLARMLNIPVKNLEKSLSELISSKRIYIRSISDGLLLTIAKWWKYQQDPTKKTESQNAGISTKKESQNSDKRRLDKIRLDESRKDEKRGESERREEKKNNASQNPHPPPPKKVEALIKEKSKSLTERKTKKPLDTSEGAFSRQMEEILTKKKKPKK